MDFRIIDLRARMLENALKYEEQQKEHTVTDKRIKRIMEKVNEYESQDKSAFIEDLLYLLNEDFVDNVEYCLDRELPLGTDL